MTADFKFFEIDPLAETMEKHVSSKVKKGFLTLGLTEHNMGWLGREPFVEAKLAVGLEERWEAWAPRLQLASILLTVASSQGVYSNQDEGSQPVRALVTCSPIALVVIHLCQWGPLFLPGYLGCGGCICCTLFGDTLGIHGSST